MTDEQIEAIALDISCGEVKGPEYGCALAGARAVRDEMQAELERVKEQLNIGHIQVHILNEQITDLQQRLRKLDKDRNGA